MTESVKVPKPGTAEYSDYLKEQGRAALLGQKNEVHKNTFNVQCHLDVRTMAAIDRLLCQKFGVTPRNMSELIRISLDALYNAFIAEHSLEPFYLTEDALAWLRGRGFSLAQFEAQCSRQAKKLSVAVKAEQIGVASFEKEQMARNESPEDFLRRYPQLQSWYDCEVEKFEAALTENHVKLGSKQHETLQEAFTKRLSSELRKQARDVQQIAMAIDSSYDDKPLTIGQSLSLRESEKSTQMAEQRRLIIEAAKKSGQFGFISTEETVQSEEENEDGQTKSE